MSFSAINWAYAQELEGPSVVEKEVGAPSLKAVLVALADRVTQNTDTCFAGVDDLKRRTELGRSTVYRALRELRARRLIEHVDVNGRAGFRLLMDSRSGTHSGTRKSRSGTPYIEEPVVEPGGIPPRDQRSQGNLRAIAGGKRRRDYDQATRRG